jgi:hypothetical protein
LFLRHACAQILSREHACRTDGDTDKWDHDRRYG